MPNNILIKKFNKLFSLKKKNFFQNNLFKMEGSFHRWKKEEREREI